MGVVGVVGGEGGERRAVLWVGDLEGRLRGRGEEDCWDGRLRTVLDGRGFGYGEREDGTFSGVIVWRGQCLSRMTFTERMRGNQLTVRTPRLGVQFSGKRLRCPK